MKSDELLIVLNSSKMMIESRSSQTKTIERRLALMATIEPNNKRKPTECLTPTRSSCKTDKNRRRPPHWTASATIRTRSRLKATTSKRRRLVVLLLIALVSLALDACQTKTKTDTFGAPITCHASSVRPEANQQQAPISDRSGSDPNQLQDDGHERQLLSTQPGANPLPATNARHKRQASQVTNNKLGSSSPSKAAPDVTRAVAVSGQTIEFQCPLTSELLATTGHANWPTKTTDQNDGQQQQQQLLNGHQAGRIIWRKDGQPLSQMNSTRLRLIEQQNSTSLTILQAQPKLDEATYECALQDGPSQAGSGNPSNGAGGTTSAHNKVHHFQLSLLVPPRLAPFEFPADAQVGMKVLLTCSALEGQQPISFVWLRDNQIIDSSASTSSGQEQTGGAGGSNGGPQRKQPIASLGQLHQQQLADKFALSAHSTISLGDKSEYVLIGEPNADSNHNKLGSSRPQHHNSELDGDEELDELAAPSASKQQQRNLAGKPKSTMHLADSSIRIRQADDYSILSIEPLELKHSGRYTCSAQNEAARVSHSSQLIINAPPTLTVEPKDGDLVSGRSIVIDCAASGQPRPTLSWLRARESNGGKQWDFVPIYENLRYTILSNGSLAINNVTQREQGFYMCSAKNGFGPEVTKLIKITVHEPARISSKYKLVEARVEEQAQLNCDAEGEQSVSLVWLDKDGKQIDKNDKRFIIDDSPASSSSPAFKSSAQHQTSNNQANVSSVSSSLIIARAVRSDSGHYTCQASNKHGQDKMVVNLLVQDVPDKVGDLKVTNVTASTISLRWQLGFTGNSPVTSYLVQYQSDDPLDDLLMSVAKNNQASPNGAQLSTLSDAMPHATTTQASSIGSDLSPSRLYNHLFGFLSDKDHEKQQQQQQQQQASSLKAALETLNSLSSSLGDLSVTTADEAIDRTLVELTVEQTATSLMIKDLSPFCVYRLRLAGINKIGLGEFSDWIRAKTEEAPPSGSALKITAAATGPNSIKLTWFPPDRRTWNGQLVRFQIGYRPIDSTYEFNKSVEWTPPTLMQSIMLDVDNKKRSSDQRSDSSRMGKFGQTLSEHQAIESMRSTPTSTTNSSSSSASSNDAEKSKSESGSSPYALKQHLRQLLAMQQQELVAHLTNLQRSTTYLVWIQAINGRGIGPQSHAISVKTLDDVPPSAPALRIQTTSTSSITIAWSMLSNFISPANQYSLFYRRVPPPSSAASHLQAIGRQQQQQQQFYPSRQQPNLAHINNVSLAQNSDNLATIFSEPGPFIERTISSQQLMHAINEVQQTGGAGGVFQLDDGDSSGLSQQQQIARQIHTAFQAHHQQQQQQQQAHQQHYQQFVYTLDQLECGSIYELYMTTRNSVGKSEPSAVVTTRTLGEPPLAPHNKNSLFVRIGAQDVLLNLASWSTGGCPLTHVNVRYKQMPEPVSAASSFEPANSPAPTSQSTPGNTAKVHPSFSVVWPVSTSVPANLLQSINRQQFASGQMRIFAPSQSAALAQSSPQAHLISGSAVESSPTINNNDQQQQQAAAAQFVLKSLQPSTGYELEIVAYNAAGHTTAQYEFVTAGPNGSRSGYMRREGVFRLDQRGQPIETGEQQSAGPSSAFAVDHQNGGAQQPSQVSTVQQLVPLVLTLLCFICLIISGAFCYHRIAPSWKQRPSRRRHSIDGMRSICSGSNGGGGPGSGSDESHLAGVKTAASLQNWSRLNAQNGGPSSSRCFKERHLHSELVDDQSPSSIQASDSPPDEQGFHYCFQEQQVGNNEPHHHSLNHHHQHHHHQQQHTMSATLNPKNTAFSQSVSMRDFNVLGALGNVPAATLNLKSGRSAMNNQQQQRMKMSAGAAVLANDFAKINATIARGGRLVTDTASGIPLTEAYGNVLATGGHRLCSNYGQTAASGVCKQKQDQIYGRHHQQQLEALYGADSSNSHLICGHQQMSDQQESMQSRETSWSTPAGAAPNEPHQDYSTSGATNYAIPATFQHQIEPAINEQTAMPYACDDVYGQGTIDACIQHLMNQQYQQQEQPAPARQQPYTMMLANQRQTNETGSNNQSQLQARCNVYGQEPEGNSFLDPTALTTTATTAANHAGNQQLYEQRQIGANYTVGAAAQSVIESSSSSSGIGVDSLAGANHLDCASTITSTANNLNGLASSNHRAYAQQVAANDLAGQQQQHPMLTSDMTSD